MLVFVLYKKEASRVESMLSRRFVRLFPFSVILCSANFLDL